MNPLLYSLSLSIYIYNIYIYIYIIRVCVRVSFLNLSPAALLHLNLKQSMVKYSRGSGGKGRGPLDNNSVASLLLYFSMLFEQTPPEKPWSPLCLAFGVNLLLRLQLLLQLCILSSHGLQRIPTFQEGFCFTGKGRRKQ